MREHNRLWSLNTGIRSVPKLWRIKYIALKKTEVAITLRGSAFRHFTSYFAHQNHKFRVKGFALVKI